MLRALTDRLDQMFASLPALGDYLGACRSSSAWRDAALLVGIVVAGLAAEWLIRCL